MNKTKFSYSFNFQNDFLSLYSNPRKIAATFLNTGLNSKNILTKKLG